MVIEKPYRHDSDADLVRRARRGNDEAFGQLVDRHGPRLLRLATSMLGNAADAEDVVQDTLAAALRGLGGFRGLASVKTWLTRILMNKIARFHRYRRLRKAASIDQVAEPADRKAAAGAHATGRADIRMDLVTVLAGLSEQHRSVILLREMQAMTYEEMAEVLAIPRGTVESRLHRARQKLKELLKDYLP